MLNSISTPFTLYTCRFRQKSNNVRYPNKVVISSIEDLRKAAIFDHVAATYRNNYRDGKYFCSSDCLIADLDNDHSDDPSDWKTPNDVAAAFPGVEFYAVESRNHMKVKNGKSERPRYHFYFPINTVSDPNEYVMYKEWTTEVFPYFDKAANDNARQLFGVENPQVYYYGGVTNVD